MARPGTGSDITATAPAHTPVGTEAGPAAAATMPRPMRRSLAVAGVLLVALVLWGGYSQRWSWTGINGHTATLWDWLKLLLLPMAVAMLPLWASRDAPPDDRIKAGALAAVAVFGLIVLAGYLVPWRWTGFVGNTLWDWLNLVALPVAVALIPLAGDLRREWSPRHTAITVAGLAVAAALVLGGYLASWRWTGFTGNTLWAWLHLLLLPLLIPTVIVPSLTPAARARMLPTAAAKQVGQAGAEPSPDGGDVKPA